MNQLIIKETSATPQVNFDIDNDIYIVQGCSRPEDVREFYYPIISWLDDLGSKNIDILKQKYSELPMVFKFKFDYFNSSSAKFILDILVIINQIHHNGVKMRIDWHFDENDDDMREVGEELSDVVDFEFDYIKDPKGTKL